MFYVKRLFIAISVIVLISYNGYTPCNDINYDFDNWSVDNIVDESVDKLFLKDEYLYNHNLAKLSLDVAVSAFSANESMEFWGDNKDCGRQNNIKKALEDMDFKNLTFYNYDTSLNSTESKAAFATGIKESNNNSIIFAIIIRGGGYGLEWIDNFNIGDSANNYHLGFYKTALQIKNVTDSVLNQYFNKYKVKIWITGYSRGGAVANILASLYDDANVSHLYSVYAYTFASPKTAVIKDTMCHSKKYGNIFNILSPDDPIYNIPPSKWGFGRFGTCALLPHSSYTEGTKNKKLLEKVYNYYYSRTGKALMMFGNYDSSLINLIIKSSPDRDFFHEYLSKPISDLILIKMSKFKNINGVWDNNDLLINIKNLYGDEFVNEFNELKNSYLFSYFKNMGLELPDDLCVFLLLCKHNGYIDYEKILFSNITLNDLSDLTKLSSDSLNFIGHTPDFYISWVNNVSENDLAFIAE